MSSATPGTPSSSRDDRPSASAVQVDDMTLHITLIDGRILAVPLAHLPFLAQATPAQRQHWEFLGENEVIFWPDGDEGVEIAHVLGMPIAP